MAILYGRVENISRGNGQSAIKAAAYRSCSQLTLNATDRDTNITVGLTWDYSKKNGLAYSQIHAPEDAPEWIYDRQSLWQRIENIETKSNARLAGEYILALPKEFTKEQNIAFLKEFAENTFTSRGIVVDVNFHNDNPNNPHAHLMYALRQLEKSVDGTVDFATHRFRELQTRAFLEGILKEEHKQLLSVHLIKNGYEQHLEWGVAKGQEATTHHGGVKEAIARNEEIIRNNADKIIADPTIIIDKLDFNKVVFSREDIEKELEKALTITLKNISASDKSALDMYIKSELTGLLDTVLLSPKLKLVNPCDLKGRMLFAKTAQMELEKRFIANINKLAASNKHALEVKEQDIPEYAKGKEFSRQQKAAISRICSGSDLSVLEGWPGSGKSTITKEIVRQYKKAGYNIVAAAPTNKAAQELETKLGIKVYTTASLRMKWQYERGAEKVSVGLKTEYYKEPLYNTKECVLSPNTLFVLDEASMLDVATSDYFVSEVRKSEAKLLALGDNNQNQAVGSRGSFARMCEIGDHNILTEVNRHENTDAEIRELHIEATSALCNYQIAKAVSIYEQLGKFNILADEAEKETAIARRYVEKVLTLAEEESISVSDAAKKVVISAYTNNEIRNLNSMIRDSFKRAGVLGNGSKFISGGIHGKSSMVELAEGDRIIFTSNLREKDGTGGVLNNELATVRKLVKVDAMGVGEFLVDIEGASGIRRTLIRTGEHGRIVTFRHGYAVTNYAVQGAGIPYKMLSIDQYSGYEVMLVGLTRHQLDCEVFAARDTLENEVYKTRDLDVEQVRKDYMAMGYKYITTTDEEGKELTKKVDIPLWKLGLHLLTSKRSDLSFAVDVSYGHQAISLQKQLNAQTAQLEALREDLNKHECELAKFEVTANTRLLDIKNADSTFPTIITDKKAKTTIDTDRTQFEAFANQHFNVDENILFDIDNVMSATTWFKVSSANRHQEIENHLTALKAGIHSGDNTTHLNWSDLSRQDQNLLLWSYIDKEERKVLADHYNRASSLREEIQVKAQAAGELWQELKECGLENREVLTGNYAVVRDYLLARHRVKESFEQSEIFNRQLTSAKIQKLLIEAINEKYSLKLKFLVTSVNGIEKANDDFVTNKEKSDSEKLEKDKGYQASSIAEDRQEYLQSLKGQEFKAVLANSNLFALDVMQSARDGTPLSNLAHSISVATREAEEAKAQRQKTAALMLSKWDGHIDTEAEKNQPKFARILGQLNVNYHTLAKHAGESREKHYFNKIVNSSLGKNSDYEKVMHMIYKRNDQELTASDINLLLKTHDGLCEHVELVSEYIEELKDERSSAQNSRNSSKSRLQAIETYQSTEFPHFISTTYKEDSKVVISKLDQLLEKTGDKSQLAGVISDNPEMLGNVKARGLMVKIFGSNEKNLVDANLENLGSRLRQYIKGKNEMQQIQQDLANGKYANKIAEIDKEINALRSILPSSQEYSILEDIGKLQNEVLKNSDNNAQIDKFTKKINALLYGEKAQDLLFNYQIKHNLFFTERSNSNKQDQASRGLKQELQQKKIIAEKFNNKPRLTFAEVKAGLNQSVVSEIFRQYGSVINPDDKIEKKGDQLKIGSLYMSISGNKTGLWNRFSNDSKGDIFSFVEEATGCSKYESLEIVARFAGIVASDNHKNTPYSNQTVKIRSATQGKPNPDKKTNEKNNWVAHTIVPDSAPLFNAEKDLAFLAGKKSKVTGSYEYRNRDNQLLGYVVRVEENENGRKQVLPVAYCHNEHLNKSRWQLKGFGDNGAKPIYGAEKLAQYPHKPILIVEGEKTADAAQKLLPDYAVISWMGGVQAVDKVDWSNLSNREITIWPDNDKPGIEATNRIANHIDCHNGFTGLVSVIDTQQLKLPAKWDLADDLPDSMKHIKLEEIITGATNNNMSLGKKLELSQGGINTQRNMIPGSLDILVAQGKICKDEYISKDIYHATISGIATTRNINLAKIDDYRDFINAVCDIQNEYQSLRKEYERRMLASQYQTQGMDESTNKPKMSKKEQLEHDITRDISILQQTQLGVNKLTTTHTEHIARKVKAEIGKMQHFTDSDKEHAAGNIYKTINNNKWREQLDTQNQKKAKAIKVQFKEQQLEAKHINSILVQMNKERQEAKTPEQALTILKKEQEFLTGLHGNLKYPEHHSKNLLESVRHAERNKQENSIDQLHKLAEFVQTKQFRTAEEMTKILKNSTNPITTYKNLLQKYQENFIATINKGLGILEKGESFKLGKRSISCPVKFLEQIVKTQMNEYAPRHEVQKIQTRVIELHKQLEMSKDMGGLSL